MMKRLHFLSLFLLLGIFTGYSQTNLPDVWDFGATQLDETQYNNQLSVEVINSWYDPSIPAGSADQTLPDFTVGDLSFTGGGSDRLRTTNTALTRYDDNIDEYEDFKGRVYINSSGATGRYFSLELEENDKVTIWALTQNGTGNIHFEFVADPSLQNDVTAVGEELTQLTFVAQAAGTYRIYDDTDKPSYFRIMRESNSGSAGTNDGQDVWDFGATQLDETQYNNLLNVEVINSWYDPSIPAGSADQTLPDFTVGDLSFTGGGSDRLRTTNTALTRYDDNIDEYEDFKGRVYINSSGATGRYFSLVLDAYDEVTIWALTQNGTGNIHFENIADPELQNDVVAVGEELSELNFTAKTAGTYKIYDDTDKPSYFRIVRSSATMATVSGTVDVSAAAGIPGGYSIVFTNENGDSWTTSASEGAYTVDLPAGYTYDIALEGADGYSVTGSGVEVTEDTSVNIVIQEDGAAGGDQVADVWDFGATQLDETQYNNLLNVEVINSWYDPSIPAGSADQTLPDFTVGDLSFTGGGSDRLRTTNTALTRYDDNIDEYEDFKGRVYINSSGATGRYFSLVLDAYDEVTIFALTQNGTGNIHFENVADPTLQNDVVAVGEELTELNFTAKTAGTYKIYDDTDKPSYFRIVRRSAAMATVTGTVDVVAAAGLPAGYSIVFTNENGDSWTTSASEDAYTVDLLAGYTYDITLEGAEGYSVVNSSIEITEDTSVNIVIQEDGAAGGNGLTDVWDFGATQLDETHYNNLLNVEVINSWYDPSIPAGSEDQTLPDFTVGDLSFTGGGSDRLRTTNTALTRYDDNIDEYEDFKGRVYINSSGATGRYFSLELNEDDEVTLWTLTQNGNGNIHFEYVADPDLQNDVVAVGEELTEISFMAKAAGTYRIYDDTDKPSYFRITRDAATYTTVTGNVDVTAAEGIPSDFNVVFTNDHGKTWELPFTTGGSFSVVLPVGYQYEVSLDGAEGYSIEGNSSLEVTESTTSFDINIGKDLVYVEGLPDVWDFGATLLDESQFNNMLNEARINSWYDESIPPGSEGHTLPDFTAGDLSFTGGGSDRLRTTNTNLTRYDDNIDDYEEFKGRIYINSRGARNRYLSLDLEEDDKVTLWVLGQDGNGEVHFENAADPALQNDMVKTSGELMEISFVAKADGTYHIYDAVDKPSYFRIVRTPATYVTITGNVDVTDAPGIPEDYSLVFEIEEGKTWTLQPTDGTYQLDLPVGFEYTVSVEGADGYVISGGSSLTVVEGTATHDITIEKVEIYPVTGSIVGLGDKIGNLALTFTPAPGTDALYVPKPVIDTEAATYSVKLEPNIQYTISANGVDGYFIPENTLEITAETTSDIVFEAEPDGPYGDIDGDGILNAVDNCVATPNPDQADLNENGVGDVCDDDDGDGIINYDDNCPDTPEGTVVDVFGCEVFNLPPNNFAISVQEVSCNGNSDGMITVTAADQSYTYNVTVTGPGTGSAVLSDSNGFSASVNNLAAGTYDVCITIDGQDGYEQCFSVYVEGPTPLAAYSSVNYANHTMSLTLDGASEYRIELNGKVITTSKSQVLLDLKTGMNKFSVSTDSDCQGIFADEVFLSEEVVLYPNPTMGDLRAYINGTDGTIDVSIIDLRGQQYMSQKMEVPSNRIIELNLNGFRDGVYFLLLKSATVNKTLKVIKS
ncbi:T9SS type A sorting domain-containing protein [Salinimicrobium sp. HB62]|uniref:T9SS type A sorting domain-containing protein n=1 Tax=Salinimicrobium sp. HB62 TaxID=3077781 RepID=UPI002D76FBFA|nr:T9SS type A sorting domain-containing protein [Salinimicrobium sp. HB62]